MMSGRGLPRGRRTKTKTIAALRLCLFLIFLVVFLLILNIDWCWFYRLSSTFVLWLRYMLKYPGNFWFSHVIWKRLECWNDRVFLYLKCVDCCLICSYHLNKAQVSEAPFSLYFKCFDSFWFSVMNHLENTQVSKAAALISTPHLRSPTPAGCPFVPPQKVFEDWTKIFLPLPVGICAPTKMYLCFFQKVFVTLLRHVIVRL